LKATSSKSERRRIKYEEDDFVVGFCPVFMHRACIPKKKAKKQQQTEKNFFYEKKNAKQSARLKLENRK
jgi:hypothetical protein